MSSVLHVNNQEFQSLISQNELVFVDFYANWCGPCKMLAPSIEKLAQEHPEIKVVKVDVDQETSLAMQFQVQSIPTLGRKRRPTRQYYCTKPYYNISPANNQWEYWGCV